MPYTRRLTETDQLEADLHIDRSGDAVVRASILLSLTSCATGIAASHAFALRSHYSLSITSLVFGCILALAIDALPLVRLEVPRSRRVALVVLGFIYASALVVIALSIVIVFGVLFILRDTEFPSPN